MIPANIEEIRKKTFELEHQLGVSRSDAKVLQDLTELQYLFVLNWCNPDIIVTNKKQWAEENGFRRDDVYQWLSAHPKTTLAVAYLQSKLNQNQCTQLAKVIYKKGMTGDIRAAKLYLEYFKPADSQPQYEIEEEETFILDHKWQNPEDSPDDRPNAPSP